MRDRPPPPTLTSSQLATAQTVPALYQSVQQSALSTKNPASAITNPSSAHPSPHHLDLPPRIRQHEQLRGRSEMAADEQGWSEGARGSSVQLAVGGEAMVRARGGGELRGRWDVR